MTQHRKYAPDAEDYLVIGPYDHFGAQRGTFSTLSPRTTVIAGYMLDQAAQIDLYDDLRFKWFDYVLRRGPKPAILKDRVNYEVTGADVWKHAPSIDAMHDRSWRLYLGADRTLGEQRAGAYTDLVVNLADRSDADRSAPGGGLLDKDIDTSNGVVFTSAPLRDPTELSGLFSGSLDFVANKRDFDFQLTLYERTASGAYFLLAPYWSRASNVFDITERHLLEPGVRTRVSFTSKRLMSHLVLPGSRIIAVLNVIKETGRQINYGTGKDVSDETIADAGQPLAIQWFDDSYIDLPAAK
jgi:hypothetical protein